MTQKQSPEIECHVLTDDDGYTLTRYIEAEPRLYAAARFTFRPVRSLRRAGVLEAKKGLTEEQSILAHAKAAAGRIVTWNMIDQKGKQLPITAESICNLHPVLMQRVFAVVIYSTDGGDIDPLESRIAEQLNDVPDLLGDDPAMGTVDREQKNS